MAWVQTEVQRFLCEITCLIYHKLYGETCTHLWSNSMVCVGSVVQRSHFGSLVPSTATYTGRSTAGETLNIVDETLY